MKSPVDNRYWMIYDFKAGEYYMSKRSGVHIFDPNRFKAWRFTDRSMGMLRLNEIKRQCPGRDCTIISPEAAWAIEEIKKREGRGNDGA